ncbi:MAG: hypothetical protein WEA10_11095 [Actinomycetota bacterium]
MALVPVMLIGLGSTATAQTAPEPRTRAVVIVGLEGVSAGEVFASDLASVGGDEVGSGLLVPQTSPGNQLDLIETLGEGNATITSVRLGRDEIASLADDGSVVSGLDAVAGSVAGDAAASDAGRVLVLVVGVAPHATMVARRDGVLPVVVAAGAPPSFDVRTSGVSLTSDSTRREGVVSSFDLLPTVSAFLGRSISDTEGGSVIRVAPVDPPVALYERYLEMRRITVPVQAAAALYVTLATLVLAVMLVLRSRGSARFGDRAVNRARWFGLSVPPLAVGLFAAGHLPRLTYPIALPFVVAVTVAGTLAVVPLARRGRFGPIVAMGIGVLVLTVIETLLGWSAALTPLLGGSQLDGGRFFGMPNVVVGLVVGAGVYAAARSSFAVGAWLLVGIALLVGLPGMGANIGAAIAACAAAGLWFVVGTRGRFDTRAAAAGLGAAVVGGLVILAIHRFAPGAPTHATRFVEGASGGPLTALTDRLEVGIELLRRSPAAIGPTLGVVVLAALGLWPARAVRPAFSIEPRLRFLVLVLGMTGILSYLVEDSGAAAAGLFFGLGLGALFYVSLPLANGDDVARP